jgi:hypothetical protein
MIGQTPVRTTFLTRRLKLAPNSPDRAIKTRLTGKGPGNPWDLDDG